MESWATELIRAIDEIELKLKEAEKHSNKNEWICYRLPSAEVI
jgi:hypothetical protein